MPEKSLYEDLQGVNLLIIDSPYDRLTRSPTSAVRKIISAKDRRGFRPTFRSSTESQNGNLTVTFRDLRTANTDNDAADWSSFALTKGFTPRDLVLRVQRKVGQTLENIYPPQYKAIYPRIEDENEAINTFLKNWVQSRQLTFVIDKTYRILSAWRKKASKEELDEIIEMGLYKPRSSSNADTRRVNRSFERFYIEIEGLTGKEGVKDVEFAPVNSVESYVNLHNKRQNWMKKCKAIENKNRILELSILEHCEGPWEYSVTVKDVTYDATLTPIHNEPAVKKDRVDASRIADMLESGEIIETEQEDEKGNPVYAETASAEKLGVDEASIRSAKLAEARDVIDKLTEYVNSLEQPEDEAEETEEEIEDLAPVTVG